MTRFTPTADDCICSTILARASLRILAAAMGRSHASVVARARRIGFSRREIQLSVARHVLRRSIAAAAKQARRAAN